MKARSLFIGTSILAGAALWGASADAQGEGLEPPAATRLTGERESALLEELEGCLHGDSLENDLHIMEIARELALSGSADAVQFLLDNIEWRGYSGRRVPPITATKMKIPPPPQTPPRPLLKVLEETKAVSLAQCVDAFLKSKGDLMKTLTLVGLAATIHGEDFLHALEPFEETMPDTEYWNSLREPLRKELPGIIEMTRGKPPAMHEGPDSGAGAEDRRTPDVGAEGTSPPDTAPEPGVVDASVADANAANAGVGHDDSATPQDAGATPPCNRIWLHVGIGGIFLGLCAVLLFARKKKSAM